MTVKADSKKRVVIPDACPGDAFLYENQGSGHFLLTRVNVAAPRRKMTRAQVEKGLKNCKIKFDFTWDELRKWTREP